MTVAGMLATLATLTPPGARAGEAEVIAVKATAQGGTWRFDVTVRHGDTGWKHYADAWRVVGPKGRVFGTRTLYHPHVDEQPFTRSLAGVRIPAGVAEVFVEAHDKVHGWNRRRMKVRLR